MIAIDVVLHVLNVSTSLLVKASRVRAMLLPGLWMLQVALSESTGIGIVVMMHDMLRCTM